MTTTFKIIVQDDAAMSPVDKDQIMLVLSAYFRRAYVMRMGKQPPNWEDTVE